MNQFDPSKEKFYDLKNHLDINILSTYPLSKGKEFFLKSLYRNLNDSKRLKLLFKSAALNFPPAFIALGILSTEEKTTLRYYNLAIKHDSHPFYESLKKNFLSTIKTQILASNAILKNTNNNLYKAFLYAQEGNFSESLKYCLLAYTQGDKTTLLKIINFFMAIDEPKQVLTFCQKGIELNDPESMILLGKLFSEGYFGQINFETAKKLFLRVLNDPQLKNSDFFNQSFIALYNIHFSELNFTACLEMLNKVNTPNLESFKIIKLYKLFILDIVSDSFSAARVYKQKISFFSIDYQKKYQFFKCIYDLMHKSMNADDSLAALGYKRNNNLIEIDHTLNSIDSYYSLSILNLASENLSQFIQNLFKGAKAGSVKACVTLFYLSKNQNPEIKNLISNLKEFSCYLRFFPIDLKKLDPLNENINYFNYRKLTYFIFLLDNHFVEISAEKIHSLKLLNETLEILLDKTFNYSSESIHELNKKREIFPSKEAIFLTNLPSELKEIPSGKIEFHKALDLFFDIKGCRELYEGKLKCSAEQKNPAALCALSLLWYNYPVSSLNLLEQAIEIFPHPIFYYYRDHFRSEYLKKFIIINKDFFTEERSSEYYSKMSLHYLAIKNFEFFYQFLDVINLSLNINSLQQVVKCLFDIKQFDKIKDFLFDGINKYNSSCLFLWGYYNYIGFFSYLDENDSKKTMKLASNLQNNEVITIQNQISIIELKFQKLDFTDNEDFNMNISLFKIFGIGTEIDLSLDMLSNINKKLYLKEDNVTKFSNLFSIAFSNHKIPFLELLLFLTLKLKNFEQSKKILVTSYFSLGVVKNKLRRKQNTYYLTTEEEYLNSLLYFLVNDHDNFIKNIYCGAKNKHLKSQITLFYIFKLTSQLRFYSSVLTKYNNFHLYSKEYPIDLLQCDALKSENVPSLEKIIFYIYSLDNSYLSKKFTPSSPSLKVTSNKNYNEIFDFVNKHEKKFKEKATLWENDIFEEKDVLESKSVEETPEILFDQSSEMNEAVHGEFFDFNEQIVLPEIVNALSITIDSDISEKNEENIFDIDSVFKVSDEINLAADSSQKEPTTAQADSIQNLTAPSFLNTSQTHILNDSTNIVDEKTSINSNQKNPKRFPTISSKYFYSAEKENSPIIRYPALEPKKISIENDKKYTLQSLKKSDLTCFIYKIHEEGLVADYYTAERTFNFQDISRVTFVRTGRMHNALVPQESSQGKIIMVASPNEAEEMLKFIDAHRDLLVIQEMPGYKNNIQHCFGNSSVRRLAALYFAWYNNISEIMILDDNVNEFFAHNHTLQENCSWGNIYDLYKNTAQTHDLSCLSIQTHNPTLQADLKESIEILPKNLGYKVLFIDINKIKEKIDTPQFLLPQDPTLWGEDIFFQTSLIKLDLLIASFSRNTIVIKRSDLNKNTCVGKVTPLKWLDYEIEMDAPNFYVETTVTMKEIYLHNQESYRKKEIAIQKMNFSEETSKIDSRKRMRQTTSFSLPKAKKSKENEKVIKTIQPEVKETIYKQPNLLTPLSSDLFNEYLQKLENCPDYLRKPQQEAIQKFKEFLEANNTTGCFNMATGTGKTILYAYLSNILTDCQHFDKNVLIITVGIQASNQVYHTFQSLTQQMQTKKEVVLINAEYLSRRVFNFNRSLENCNKKIYVFCKESALIFFKQNPNTLNRFGSIILDEFHDLPKSFLDYFIKFGETKSSLILGFSATPPLFSLKEIYKYPLLQGYKDGFLAPWVVDKIRLPFLLEEKKTKHDKYARLLDQLPTILENHVHPHGEVLSKNQGIIRVGKKTKTCATLVANEVAELLQSKQIFAASYHSLLSENQRAEILQRFMKKELKALVVVDMLGQAFDAQVDYVFFTKKIKSEVEYFQNLGRVVRPGLNKRKIAYMVLPECIPLPTHAYLPSTDPLWQKLDRNYPIQESTYKHEKNTTFPIISQVQHQEIPISFENVPQSLNSKDFTRLPLKRGPLTIESFTLALHVNQKNPLLIRTLKPFFKFLFDSKNQNKIKNTFEEIKNRGDKNINSILSQLSPIENGFFSIYSFNPVSQNYVFKHFIGNHGENCGVFYEKNPNEFEILVPISISRFFCEN